MKEKIVWKIEKIVDNTSSKEPEKICLKAEENNSDYNDEFICWNRNKNESAYNPIYDDIGILAEGVRRETWRRIANVIITNLAPVDVGDSLNYLRGEKHFKKGTYYSYEKITYRPFKRVIDWLAHAGYLTHTIGDNDPKIGKVFSTMSPTQKLKDKIRECNINQKDISYMPSMPVLLRKKRTFKEYMDENDKKQKKKIPGDYIEVKVDAKHTKTMINLMNRYYDEIIKHDFTRNAPKEIRKLY